MQLPMPPMTVWPVFESRYLEGRILFRRASGSTDSASSWSLLGLRLDGHLDHRVGASMTQHDPAGSGRPRVTGGGT